MAASRSRAAGFTLVELLVVVAIVVLLVAILLPVCQRARGTAVNQVCKNNLRQIGAAIRMYADDHKGRFADPYTLGGSQCRRLVGETDPRDPSGAPETYGWSALLDQLGYLKPDRTTGGSWLCPAADERVQSYKNCYVAWTMPRGPGQNGAHNQWQIVSDNVSAFPYAPGVNAADRNAPAWYSPQSPALPDGAPLYRGPHQYRLAVNGHPMPQNVSGIPNGTVFFANGYVHALHADLSLGTYQIYGVIVGNDFIAAMSEERVE